jgi:hypothetical protein
MLVEALQYELSIRRCTGVCITEDPGNDRIVVEWGGETIQFDLVGRRLFARNLATTRRRAEVLAHINASLSMPSPPKAAEQLIRLVVDARTQDAVLGDLQEIYVESITPQYGEGYARIWYWVHAVRTCASFGVDRTISTLSRLGEAIRKFYAG